MKFQNKYIETKELYFEKYGVLSEKSLHIEIIVWIVLAISNMISGNTGFVILFFTLALLQFQENAAKKDKHNKEYNRMWEQLGKNRSIKTNFFDDKVVVEVDGEDIESYCCCNLLGFREEDNFIRLYFVKEEAKKLNKKGKIKVGALGDGDIDIICIKKDGFLAGSLEEFKQFLKEKQCTKYFVI